MNRASTFDRPALLGGEPIRRHSFIRPRACGSDLARLEEVLRQDDWGGIPFPNVMHRRFAEAFSKRLDNVESVLVANGSVAISLALRALDLAAGDEVLVPSLTWVATASAAIHVNLVPVLVDIEPRHYCIDPAHAEAAITQRTRAIVVVHLANQVADMDRILDIARRHDLFVIEDCAHAHFARWQGKAVGSLGHVGTFSFESSKIVTSGEGGAVVSRDTDTLMRVMSLTNVGRKLPPYNQFSGEMLGFNARATEFQAAVLLGQLETLEERSAARCDNLCRLVEAVESIGGLTLVTPDARVTQGQCYEVLFRYDPESFSGLPRDRFCEALLAEGVEIEGMFYDPLHCSVLMRATSRHWPMLRERYGDVFDGSGIHCPVAERAAYSELLWIHHSLLSGTTEDIDDIIRSIIKVKRHAAALR